MPTPLYDDPNFFDGYARIRDNPLSANDVLDMPAIESLLPPTLDGLRVLDLGCGTGGLCRYMAEKGAKVVLGVDVSERMLQVARDEGDANGRIVYAQIDIENFGVTPSGFDVIVSSLALHYIGDIYRIFASAHEWLAPNGTLVFSVEHPVTTAGLPPYEGWERDSENKRAAFRLTHYFDEGERVRTWIVDGVTTYHRTVSTYLNALIYHGFTVEQILEPTVSPDFARAHPQWESERQRPLFLCVKARKIPLGR